MFRRKVTVDPELITQDELMDRADLIVIGTPHERYAKLETAKPVIDIWGVTGTGVRV